MVLLKKMNTTKLEILKSVRLQSKKLNINLCHYQAKQGAVTTYISTKLKSLKGEKLNKLKSGDNGCMSSEKYDTYGVILYIDN